MRFDDLRGDAEGAVEVLDVGLRVAALRMRRAEPSSVGRTTVQIWWLLSVSRTVGQEMWMLWSRSVFSIAISRW